MLRRRMLSQCARKMYRLSFLQKQDATQTSVGSSNIGERDVEGQDKLGRIITPKSWIKPASFVGLRLQYPSRVKKESCGALSLVVILLVLVAMKILIS